MGKVEIFITKNKKQRVYTDPKDVYKQYIVYCILYPELN